VSPEGRPVRSGGRAMNEILEHRSAGNGRPARGAAAVIEPSEVRGSYDAEIGIDHASANFDHTVLAEVISSRWTKDRPCFTLNTEARGGRLEASWLRQPANSDLELHWSRRCPCIPRKRLTDAVPRVRLLVRPYGKR